MNVHFLYPCDPFDNKKADEQYQDEFESARNHGLHVHLFNQDEIAHSLIKPALSLENTKIVYRGWMLDKAQYEQLEQRFGNSLLTSCSSYLKAHHLPGWYEMLKPWTIASVIISEHEAIDVMNKLNRPMFIKDYVKSLKTGKGSIVENADDVKRALDDMLFYRTQIEGGIVLRDKMDFQPESEKRFFIINHQVYGLNDAKDNQWEMAIEVSNVLKEQAPELSFVSLDVALLTDNQAIVVEMGDGQVSDYTGWNVNDFVEKLAYLDKLQPGKKP